MLTVCRFFPQTVLPIQIPQMGFLCLSAFPSEKRHLNVWESVYVGLYSSHVSACVCLCCFGPMGDCYHCCVKQIRELGGFGRITTPHFWTTLKARYIVNCIPMHVQTHTNTHTHLLEIHTQTQLELEYSLAGKTMLLLGDSAKPQITFNFLRFNGNIF